MRSRAPGVDGRLFALRQVHLDLIRQLKELESLRERLRVAERKADARMVHMRRTFSFIRAQTGTTGTS